MIRTQVYLPEDLYRDLKFIAANKKERFSDLIREGARIVVKKRTARPKKLLGNLIGAGGHGGPRDLARKIDYYLYGKGSKWVDKKLS